MISVVVPVYNVERYVERCVRSLFEQTLDDIEYIFVDDATVVTIMVTITSGNPDRYAGHVQTIELNDEPILRDWEELWSGE